jgi:hypothetical protein
MVDPRRPKGDYWAALQRVEWRGRFCAFWRLSERALTTGGMASMSANKMVIPAIVPFMPLPNAYAPSRRQVISIGSTDVECCVPSIDVP